MMLIRSMAVAMRLVIVSVAERAGRYFVCVCVMLVEVIMAVIVGHLYMHMIMRMVLSKMDGQTNGHEYQRWYEVATHRLA